MSYFTTVVDEKGKVATFADLYGLDNKMATALFGDATGFPLPPPEATRLQAEGDAAAPVKRTAAGNDIVGWLRGFAGD